MLTIYLLYKTHINHKHKLLVETAVIIESTDIYIYIKDRYERNV